MKLPPQRLLFFLAAGLLVAAAALLRYSQIERRPFHADEGVQGYQAWQLLRGAGYTYDPADKHGPFLYYATFGIARVAGWSDAMLDETDLRLITLLAGLGTLTLLAGSATRLGAGPALVAMAVLAMAPLAVIYDTYFVQETWFSFFTWALFFALLALFDRPGFLPAVLAGLLAGLMQATKETSVIHFVALAAALIAFKPLKELLREWRRLLVALLTALLVYVIFYSAGFTHWSGVVDGLRTYAGYAGRAAESPHNQPWYYYLGMLWPHVSEGVRWGEPLLLVLAVAGVGLSVSRRASPAQRALAIFTVTLLGLYSLIPYKTPWLLLTPYVGLTLLAGVALVQSAQWLPAALTLIMPVVLSLGLMGETLLVDQPALRRYPNDARNPYIYQPTSPQVPVLVRRLREIAAQTGHPLRIAVVSPDSAWPLPWYLRQEATVGFFATPPPQLPQYDVTLYDTRLSPQPPAGGAEVFSLRPNVLLWLNCRPTRP